MDKKTLPLVILLAVMVFFYWPILEFLGLSEPAPEQTATETIQTEPVGQPNAETNFQQPANNQLQPATGENPDLLATQATTQELVAQEQITQAEAELIPSETTVISTNKFTVTLSTRGGGPVSIILKEHTLRDGGPIEMLPEATSATPEALFGGGTYSTSKLNFASDLPVGNYEVTSSPYEITYRYRNDNGGEIIRHYTFYADSYHYDFDFQVTNPASFGFESRYDLNWQTPIGIAEPNPRIDYEAMQAVAMQGGSRESLDDYDDYGKLNQQLTGGTSWAGLRNKYFSAIMIPRNRVAEAVSAAGYARDIKIGEDVVEERKLTVGLQMPFVSTSPIADNFSIFVGPMDYELMADYDLGLEDMLDIGTMPFVGWIIKPFAIGIMWLLPRLYSVVPNYGFVIILFAFLVKLVTLPLSKKQFASMQAMKDLAPQIEKIKEKYKKKPNPQAVNQETMKLYKKHGVNPMAGCLPMLPQMPLFIAMFSVFKATVLLRGADFIWFIDDLSRGAESYTDPYMILVILMVAAQFVSQKLTMGTNQQNKTMMMMMPIFMGWMFHSFAAGLVLYWTCFSVFSLMDYFLFKKKALNPQVKTS